MRCTVVNDAAATPLISPRAIDRALHVRAARHLRQNEARGARCAVRLVPVQLDEAGELSMDRESPVLERTQRLHQEDLGRDVSEEGDAVR